MMGSKLLRAGDAERGFAGIVNRQFRNGYEVSTPRILTGNSENYRPVVFGTVWVIVTVLMVPFLHVLFRAKLRAPQGRSGSSFLGVIQSSANCHPSIKPTLFANQVLRRLSLPFPESDSLFSDYRIRAVVSEAW